MRIKIGAGEAAHLASATSTAAIIYIVFTVISLLYWYKGYRRVSAFKEAELRATAAEAIATN